MLIITFLDGLSIYLGDICELFHSSLCVLLEVLEVELLVQEGSIHCSLQLIDQRNQEDDLELLFNPDSEFERTLLERCVSDVVDLQGLGSHMPLLIFENVL